MIFVTVGSDLPFDRLVRVVDQWAFENGRSDVFAQIGETDFQPKHVAYSKFLAPPEFSKRIAAASVIIAHAGMGTILSTLRAEKPILVMPRRLGLREVRNEHQLATARRLSTMGKIHVAFDENELRERLMRLDELRPKAKIGAFADEGLLSALRQFVHRT